MLPKPGDTIINLTDNEFSSAGSLFGIKITEGELSIYNPECCDTCRNGFGAMCSWGEAVAMSGNNLMII